MCDCNMSIEVVRDCSDLWSRLFDHRPFLNSEIKSFIKEFEESRRGREHIGLSEILNTLKNCNEVQIPKACETSDKLKQLNTILEVSIENCATILENESQYDIDKTLKEKREMRSAEWDKFMVEIESEYTQIDKTFKSKEEELKEFYEELEKKLLS